MMKAVKKTISIPEDLCKKTLEVSDNFSATVVVALEDYLHHLKVKKAFESFGRWEKREEDSIRLVNRLRVEGSRGYANRSH